MENDFKNNLVNHKNTWQASGDAEVNEPAQNMETGSIAFRSNPERRHSFIAIVLTVDDCKYVALGPLSFKKM